MADTTFCDVTVPDYVPKECGVDRAGIISIGLIDLDQNPTRLNLESEAFWEARIAASPQLYYVINKTRGEYAGGQPTTEDGFGTEASRVTGADHTATVEVEGLSENRDFWEGVNRKRWKLVMITAGELMYYVSKPVSVYAKINNQRNIKGAAFWTVELKWQDFSNPEVFEAPDIFLEE